MIDVLIRTEMFEMLSHQTEKLHSIDEWNAALTPFAEKVAAITEQSDMSLSFRTLTYTGIRLRMLYRSQAPAQIKYGYPRPVFAGDDNHHRIRVATCG